MQLAPFIHFPHLPFVFAPNRKFFIISANQIPHHRCRQLQSLFSAIGNQQPRPKQRQK